MWSTCGSTHSSMHTWCISHNTKSTKTPDHGTVTCSIDTNYIRNPHTSSIKKTIFPNHDASCWRWYTYGYTCGWTDSSLQEATHQKALCTSSRTCEYDSHDARTYMVHHHVLPWATWCFELETCVPETLCDRNVCIVIALRCDGICWLCSNICSDDCLWESMHNMMYHTSLCNPVEEVLSVDCQKWSGVMCNDGHGVQRADVCCYDQKLLFRFFTSHNYVRDSDD